MAEVRSDKRPLDDVMLAMDVVDTLRHRELLVERELNAEDRDKRMLERLREIYASQGIEVPDNVLEEGVAALKENRFVYTPPAGGYQTALARFYVSRSRWGKPLVLGVAAAVVLWLAYLFLIVAPAERELAALPAELENRHQAVVELASDREATRRADALLAAGRSALADSDPDEAASAVTRLETLQEELQLEYTLRIVSRPGEASGVWRIPDANPDARNYYIVVEAVTPDGQVLQRPIVSEEDGQTYRVDKWALRVDEDAFERIAADKQDDGIIQDNVFGVKRRGHLAPEYRIRTTGRAITSW